MSARLNPPSGHVFRLERVRGPVWSAKYRLADGRQMQRSSGRPGRVAVGARPATHQAARGGLPALDARAGAARDASSAHGREMSNPIVRAGLFDEM